MNEILKYFPDLTERQLEQFGTLMEVYTEWNQKINVISRKDIDELYTRHVLHSLAIPKFSQFVKGTEVMDIGTGGGFPGIPLAIFYPDCQFLLVDSIEKKIKVVREVAEALGLENVEAYRGRAEDVKRKFDFVVCRAVAKIEKLMMWTQRSYKTKQRNALPNGMLALKGGDLTEELSVLRKHHEVQELSSYFEEDFFETKKLVYVQHT